MCYLAFPWNIPLNSCFSTSIRHWAACKDWIPYFHPATEMMQNMLWTVRTKTKKSWGSLTTSYSLLVNQLVSNCNLQDLQCVQLNIKFCEDFARYVLLYSQARSSVPPKLYYWEVESVGSCRFQIHLCILACVMSSEFTREAVTKFLPTQFPWIWCKCLLRNIIYSKIFNLTWYREVLASYSVLITHAEMPIWIWQKIR